MTREKALSFLLPSPKLARYAGGTEIYDRSRTKLDLMTYAIADHSKRFPASSGLDPRAASGTPWLNASRVETGSDPFPHLIAAQAVEPLDAAALLTWLETVTNWRLNDGGFYAAYENDLSRQDPPIQIAALFSAATLLTLEGQATRIFGLPLVLSGAIAGHKMGVGAGIGIHTDTPRPEEETHRLIITLARDPGVSGGGHFLLLDGLHPSSARRFIPLAHNIAIAFPLSDVSYHAVTTIRSGRRFSIVFSFRPRHAQPV